MTRRLIYWVIAAVLVALALGFAVLRWTSEKAETGAAIPPPTGSSDRPFAAGPDRASFINSSMSSCASEVAAKQPLGRALSDAETEAYCRCYSNGMADVITADEVRRMSAGEPPMAVVRDKAVRVLQSCQQQLLPK